MVHSKSKYKSLRSVAIVYLPWSNFWDADSALDVTYLNFSWQLQIQANRSHLSLSLPALITFSACHPDTSFIVQVESGKIFLGGHKSQTDRNCCPKFRTNAPLHNEDCHVSLTLNEVCQERFNHSQHYSRYINCFHHISLYHCFCHCPLSSENQEMLKCSFICRPCEMWQASRVIST